MWVLEGALEHFLCLDLLERVASKHAKIGTVPSGYYYPELFVVERKAPQANE